MVEYKEKLREMYKRVLRTLKEQLKKENKELVIYKNKVKNLRDSIKETETGLMHLRREDPMELLQ